MGYRDQINGDIHDLIATAIYENRIPENRLELFNGISAEDRCIVKQLEKLGVVGVKIIGSVVINGDGVHAYKAARTVFNIISINLIQRLEHIAWLAVNRRVEDDDRSEIKKEFKIARLVLSIDRRWNWLSQLTVERLCAAVKGLNMYCSETSLQRSHTSELLHDFRDHTRSRPKKTTHA